MQKEDDWLKQATQRCIDAGVCREPTEAEWDEALAPLTAKLLAKQEENVVTEITKRAQLRPQQPKVRPDRQHHRR